MPNWNRQIETILEYLGRGGDIPTRMIEACTAIADQASRRRRAAWGVLAVLIVVVVASWAAPRVKQEIADHQRRQVSERQRVALKDMLSAD